MFQAKRKIDFYMCDPAGILFYAKLFELAHSVYEEFVLESELEKNYFEDDIIAIPILKAEADFNRPIKLHEEINIELIVTEIKYSTFELTTQFLSLNDELKATVKTVHVFISKDEFKKVEIPGEFRQLLQTIQD
ncbi:MAG: acyl-CoA thioesterase [Melioribacteraceae bacterium]|nr:acyl-CoA thioesterase [Melioribacteraceae bacterium]